MSKAAPSTGERMTLTLKFPVTFQGIPYATISLRRPKLKDSRLLVDAEKDPVGSQARFFGQLAEVPPGVIEELDAADFKELQGWVASFTSDIETKS
jgi:Phage tail assembly chaperone proteins, E, or 41 or 14